MGVYWITGSGVPIGKEGTKSVQDIQVRQQNTQGGGLEIQPMLCLGPWMANPSRRSGYALDVEKNTPLVCAWFAGVERFGV
jgi:hypothetical protein